MSVIIVRSTDIQSLNAVTLHILQEEAKGRNVHIFDKSVLEGFEKLCDTVVLLDADTVVRRNAATRVSKLLAYFIAQHRGRGNTIIVKHLRKCKDEKLDKRAELSATTVVEVDKTVIYCRVKDLTTGKKGRFHIPY